MDSMWLTEPSSNDAVRRTSSPIMEIINAASHWEEDKDSIINKDELEFRRVSIFDVSTLTVIWNWCLIRNHLILSRGFPALNGKDWGQLVQMGKESFSTGILNPGKWREVPVTCGISCWKVPDVVGFKENCSFVSEILACIIRFKSLRSGCFGH